MVFCNCEVEETFEGVEYKPLLDYSSYIVNNEIDTCFISRYPEYLPLTYKGNVKNVYLALHDLIPEGEIIIRHDKLKNIICLSEWQSENFKNMFSTLKDLVIPFGYGIDFNLFNKEKQVERYKFIYSSFPHRGLLPLVQMWRRIHEKYPSAVLHIHCDLDGTWVNSVRPKEIQLIKEIIREYPDGIYYEGWTSKKDLSNNWNTSEVWLYPCTFLETFCLTALEAAISNTLVITSDLGALKNTVGDRGIVIKGDAYKKEWQDEALEKLFIVLEDEKLKKSYLDRNYKWAENLSWENRAKDLLEIIPKQIKKEENNKEINVNDMIDYLKFKKQNKTLNILQVGRENKDLNNKKGNILEIGKKIIMSSEHNYEIIDKEEEMDKMNSIFDTIIASKMNASDFDYYLVLMKCYNLLSKDGIMIINDCGCVNDFVNSKQLRILERANDIICVEK